MPNAYGQRLRLRLFLEGIEVPVIAANVQTAPNSPVISSIQIPPLAEGTRLLPRTLVHLFFLDDYEAKLPELNSESAATTSPEKEPDAARHQRWVDARERGWSNIVDKLNGPDEDASASGSAPDSSALSNYKLLFGGEVVGFVWNKNSSSRNLVLQCQDFSNYWDYAYQYSNTGIFGPGRQALFSGGASNMHTDFLRSKSSVITEIVAKGRCNSFPDLKGLAAGIIKLLETIGGTYYPNPRSNNSKRIAGQNMFFSLAEIRLHITHTLAAYENDPTTERLLKRGGWLGMFNRRLGGLGKQTSFRKAVNALSGTIFHDMYAQPCPRYKPGKFMQPTKKIVSFGNAGLSGHADSMLRSAKAAISKIDIASERLTSRDLKGQGGVAFKSKVSAKDLLNDVSKIVNGMTSITGKMRDSAQGTSAQSIVSTLNRTLVEAFHLSNTAKVFLRPPDIQKLRRLLIRVGQLAKKLKSGKTTRTVKAQREAPQLKQHIFRPDIWFGSPPRCNVLFPEDYDSLSYQRLFLQEPTRLLLKTNDEFFGEAFLFDKLYFAPQTGSVKKDQARFLDIKRGDLLSHEIMTGVLPVFQKSGEFNIFASNGSVNRDTPSFKDGYAQRAANFMYFKMRFNSRQMRVSGKFNPYIACGFPGLIIDRYIDFPTLELHNALRKQVNEGRRDKDTGAIPLQDISKALGTNFLGNFTAVTHNISQEGAQGRTEITCSFPRQPEETVEFLGREDQASTVLIDVDDNAVRATAVAAYNPPKLYSLGPNGGQIIAVTEVTQSHAPTRVNVPVNNAEERFALAQSLPLFRAKKKRQGRVQRVDVPIGIPVTARQLNSPDVQDITGGPDIEIVFKAYQIEEEIPRYRRERVDKPMEDLVHPGWYGDVWRPANIGKAYQDFFGIGSINDPQSVGFTGAAGIPNEQGSQAVEGGDLAQSSDDPRADLISELALTEGSSIQNAVDFLVQSYSFVRQNNLNVDEFTRAYSWRPIANMLDIFGTTDLRFSEDGERVLQGIEGFHSRAFGPYDNLFGLVTPEIKSVLGIERNTTAAQRADTRGRKQRAVQQLVAALSFSRGLLG